MRFGNCYLRVPLMFHSCCLLSCCQGKIRELTKPTYCTVPLSVQRLTLLCAPGFVKFSPAVARLFCLALPGSFLNMFAQNKVDLCRLFSWFDKFVNMYSQERTWCCTRRTGGCRRIPASSPPSFLSSGRTTESGMTARSYPVFLCHATTH